MSKTIQVKDIAQYEDSDSELSKYTITNLQQRVEQLEKELEQKEAILGGIQQLEYKCKQLENVRKEVINYIKGNEKEYGSLEDNEKIILDILNKGSE